jgi:hypothetical protein
MAKLTPHCTFLLKLAAAAGPLASCGGPTQSVPTTPPMIVQAPAPAPSVPAVVRHYASLMAQGARLTTPASRQLSGFLDGQQRLQSVDLSTPRPPEDPHRLALYVPPPPAQLVRLGQLRQLFGVGAPGPYQALNQYYFTYQPSAASPAVTIQAFMPSASVADAALVDHLSIFIAPK